MIGNNAALFARKKIDPHDSSRVFGLVETFKIRETLLNLCQMRDDDWAEEVQPRVLGCTNLLAVSYHRDCVSRFQLRKPKEFLDNL